MSVPNHIIIPLNIHFTCAIEECSDLSEHFFHFYYSKIKYIDCTCVPWLQNIYRSSASIIHWHLCHFCSIEECSDLASINRSSLFLQLSVQRKNLLFLKHRTKKIITHTYLLYHQTLYVARKTSKCHS